MSTQYPGYPSNESLHGSSNIASSTNATPIVITTSAAHDINDGDRVIVQDHGTNTAANGIWSAKKLSSTTVSLHTSVTPSGTSGPVAGNGVGGATGTIRSLGLNPTFQLPSDGDDPTAASVNVALEDAGDRSAYILTKIGVWKNVFESFRVANDLASAAGAPTTYGTDNVIGASWTRRNVTGPHNLDAFLSSAPDVLDGDIVEAEWSATIDTTVVGHASLYFGIGVEFFESGASPVVAVGAACTKVQGSAVLTQNNVIASFTCRSRFLVSNGVSRFMKMQLYFASREVVATAGTAYGIVDDFQWHVRILRNTGLYE